MAGERPTRVEKNTLIEVRTPARLHLGMLSFGNPHVRSFGGVGVMVDRPGITVRMRPADRFEGRGVLGERAIRFAQEAAQAWGLGQVACAIEVMAAPRSHVGLGSGTQLAMAVAAGMRHLFRSPPEPAAAHEFEVHPSATEWLFDTHDVVELAAAVGRGKRSCVGIYGFSRGGLIVEAGRLAADKGERLSPMVARVRLPSSWRSVVIVQRDSVGLHGDAEKEAFSRLPPVPVELTAEMARVALMDLVPAAIEGNFAAFSDAVASYGRLAGRPFESESKRLPHAQSMEYLLSLLREVGVSGAAQSSWGPAVMACCESLDAAGALVEQLDALGLLRQYDATIARFDSQGAVLRELEPMGTGR